jgi:two-component system, chemotaxis family, chemotaxis protein CheY
MSADLNMSILVVDDSPTTIRITKDALRNLGYANVDIANGGNSALEKMRIKAHDLVISDWNMEPMTGLDLLRYVRTGLDQTPFILMTAEAHVENVIVAKKAAVNGLIVKPFSAATMKAKIDAVLADSVMVEV